MVVDRFDSPDLIAVIWIYKVSPSEQVKKIKIKKKKKKTHSQGHMNITNVQILQIILIPGGPHENLMRDSPWT